MKKAKNQFYRKLNSLLFLSIMFSMLLIGANLTAHAQVADSSQSSSSYDWPMFHYDLAHTGSSNSFGPETNAILWSREIGNGNDRAISSPALADGKIYTGTSNGRIWCFDALNGQPLWNYQTEGGVYSSPAVYEGKIYVGSDDRHVYCLDAVQGFQVWNFTTNGKVAS